jgi:hypothetical protein
LYQNGRWRQELFSKIFAHRGTGEEEFNLETRKPGRPEVNQESRKKGSQSGTQEAIGGVSGKQEKRNSIWKPGSQDDRTGIRRAGKRIGSGNLNLFHSDNSVHSVRKSAFFLERRQNESGKQEKRNSIWKPGSRKAIGAPETTSIR